MSTKCTNSIRRVIAGAAACLLSVSGAFAQTYTVGNGTSVNFAQFYPSPFGDEFEGTRQQFLYLASELTAAGMSAGSISGISWNVKQLNMATAHEQFTIKIGTTASSQLTATGWVSGLTTVYGPSSYTPTTGVNSFSLTSPFSWNGTSNIVIEICHGDPMSTSTNTFSDNAGVEYTVLPFRASRLYWADDAGNQCGATSTDTFYQQAYRRPNTTFIKAASSGCTAPANLKATNVTSGSAAFSWTATPGATGYEYWLSYSATPPASGAAIGSINLSIGSMSANTTHYLHVRAKCGTTFSPWSTISFKTATSGCQAPATLTAMKSGSSVTLTWTAPSGATGYQYDVTTNPAPPVIGGTASTGTTATKTGLPATGTYYAHVRTECSTYNYSPWKTYQIGSATSVSNVQGRDDFRISVAPNPAAEQMTIRAEGRPGGHATIVVSDMAGRAVLHAEMQGIEINLNMKALPAGIYLLRYADAGHSEVIRIRKQ